ncbi:MAG: glycoside hydrolase family 43 protein [Prevotella sp.]|nr:glycoside hydrolase family 43 protein [Prevotella sp.]
MSVRQSIFIVFAAVCISGDVAAQDSVALFDYFTYKGCDGYYNSNPLPDESAFYNPILPGWYSDPSICTNGKGDYFLVTSTFVYFPGVPIFHSRDLVNWKLIGHVLSRPSQLVNMQGQGVSGGIFAPAISYNPANGTYYMITTNVGWGTFFVKTEDPFGSWSDPIRLPEVKGIDPSFFFDDDGHAYIINNDDAPDYKPEYSGHRTIRIREFDTAADKTIGEERILVNKGVVPADNPIWIEGPHMYKIRGSYFLMSAEGGTGGRHSEVVFKSDSPFGEFVPWEHNPILTQRTLSRRDNPVTCAGHADLVQTLEGDWWAVFLGCRPLNNDFENLGRETFLMPVKWSDDGFPYMTQGDDLVPLVLSREGVTRGDNVTFGNFDWTDEFDNPALGAEWLTLRSPATGLYSLADYAGQLALYPSDVSTTEELTPAFIGRRLQHHVFECSTRMHFNPQFKGESAGLLLFKDETHQYFMALELSAGGDKEITLRRIGDDGESVLAVHVAPESAGDVYMKITSSGLAFAFSYSSDGDNWTLLKDDVDARYLSTALAGGFTGTLVGMYAKK